MIRSDEVGMSFELGVVILVLSGHSPQVYWFAEGMEFIGVAGGCLA